MQVFLLLLCCFLYLASAIPSPHPSAYDLFGPKSTPIHPRFVLHAVRSLPAAEIELLARGIVIPRPLVRRALLVPRLGGGGGGGGRSGGGRAHEKEEGKSNGKDKKEWERKKGEKKACNFSNSCDGLLSKFSSYLGFEARGMEGRGSWTHTDSATYRPMGCNWMFDVSGDYIEEEALLLIL